MESSGMSKSDIRMLFDKIKTEPEFEMDPNRVRVLRTKIDRIYLALIANETITKEQLLKHKIELNKILDDVLNTIVVRWVKFSYDQNLIYFSFFGYCFWCLLECKNQTSHS